jgi:hypothetical protein
LAAKETFYEAMAEDFIGGAGNLEGMVDGEEVADGMGHFEVGLGRKGARGLC